ncbi:MAG: YggT family protein [Steroidobacteraceae bacterium]
MAALSYLIDTLLSLALLAVLLRLLLQWARADFRNPLVRSLVQITNPLLVPLRRVLPAVGRIDTASVVVVIVVALLRVSAITLLGRIGLPQPLVWLALAAVQIARTVLWIYFVAIFTYALLGMIAPGTYSPAQGALASLCEPLLRQFRRLIPPLANLDFSPLWACILIQALLLLLP